MCVLHLINLWFFTKSCGVFLYPCVDTHLLRRMTLSLQKTSNGPFHLLWHPTMWVTFSRLRKHWLPGAQTKTNAVKMAVHRISYDEEASWHVRNTLPAQTSRKSDYALRTEVPQFTVHTSLYFPANAQQCSRLQKTHLLTEHFSNSWERIMNWDWPDHMAVTIAHPSVVFTRLALWKNVALSYQEKKIGGYLWSYNDEK